MSYELLKLIYIKRIKTNKQTHTVHFYFGKTAFWFGRSQQNKLNMKIMQPSQNVSVTAHHLHTLHERQSNCHVSRQTDHTCRGVRSGLQQCHHSLHPHPTALRTRQTGQHVTDASNKQKILSKSESYQDSVEGWRCSSSLHMTQNSGTCVKAELLSDQLNKHKQMWRISHVMLSTSW